MNNAKAEIISIGTEILLGEIVDTNAAFLARQLAQLGINLYWVTQVGDNQERLIEVLNRAWQRSDIILTTGGLGPTEDDLTRESISEMLGEKMTVDLELEQWLRGVFDRMGRGMPERNIKQATLIPSAKACTNHIGTAPGWWVQRDSRIVLAMPGPPEEMHRMWESEIKDDLRQIVGQAVIVSRTLKVVGLSEARVDELVSPFLASQNPSIGVYARASGIELRLTAKASDAKTAFTMIEPLEASIRPILSQNIWGVDDDTFEMVIGKLLLDRGLTLATMESCTGGLLANLLTDGPGSSAYFKGGLVAYSNELKELFGVDKSLIEQYGAVSSQVADAMAEAARTRLGADVGIGITGVAGPDELEGKPVGTIFVCVTDGIATKSNQSVFQQHRARIKRRAAMQALTQLRMLLLNAKAG